jgi:hypothetical protein
MLQMAFSGQCSTNIFHGEDLFEKAKMPQFKSTRITISILGSSGDYDILGKIKL